QLSIRLRRAGLVQTLRGVNGGLRLLRPAEEITVWDIMQALEEKGCATERTIQVNMFEAVETSLLDANALCWRNFLESQRAALSNVSLASICHSANVVEGVGLR
ncbi:MAG: hypothetical protein GY883_03260, partial [Shimia sp.]|nr:hypothetical protein [Shimia sp.]